MEEWVGYWRRLHNEELRNLYTSSNIIMVIKSSRMSGRACGTDERDEKCIKHFGRKTRREET
jgi:hypothetical protein